MVNTVLYIVNSENYFQSVEKIFKTQLKGKKVIYVTTNKPYTMVVNSFKNAKVDTRNIFFIDCISKTVKSEEAADNCIFLDGPQNVTELGIAINQSVNKIAGDKTLFLDSLSTLLVYNDEGIIGRFSNFLINKMRVANVSTCIMALESDADKKVIKTIESFVDEVKKFK